MKKSISRGMTSCRFLEPRTFGPVEAAHAAKLMVSKVVSFRCMVALIRPLMGGRVSLHLWMAANTWVLLVMSQAMVIICTPFFSSAFIVSFASVLPRPDQESKMRDFALREIIHVYMLRPSPLSPPAMTYEAPGSKLYGFAAAGVICLLSSVLISTIFHIYICSRVSRRLLYKERASMRTLFPSLTSLKASPIIVNLYCFWGRSSLNAPCCNRFPTCSKT